MLYDLVQLFQNSVFDHVTMKDNKNWMTIPYKYNRLIVFDPQSPHCVLDVQSGTEKQPRSTFTMAAWNKEIHILR